MSFFHAFCMWSLRALAAWAVLEGGFVLFDRVDADSQRWTLVAASNERLAHLRDVAIHTDLALRKRFDELGAVQTELTVPPAGFASDPISAIQNALRDEFVAAGAQNVAVNISVDHASSAFSATCDAAWTETPDDAGRALNALTVKHPTISVIELMMARTDAHSIQTTLRFKIMAKPVIKAPS